MPGQILKEIRQKRPYALLEEEAFVNLQRTADVCLRPVVAELKQHGLSLAQYNILRILRGARPRGLPCGEIAARMITRDPDITRLLDRLEVRGLVRRERQRVDRRVIQVRITAEGLRLVNSLDEPVQAIHRRQFGRLGAKRLRELVALLELVRRMPPRSARS